MDKSNDSNQMLQYFLNSPSSSSSSSKKQSTNEQQQQQQRNEMTFHHVNEPASSMTSINSSPNLLLKHSKQKKNEKIFENLLWNLSVIKTELDNLNHLKNECESYFKQVCVEDTCIWKLN